MIYDLRFDCVYVVRLRDSADRVSGHVLVTTPTCEHVTVVGDVTPDCPPKGIDNCLATIYYTAR